MNVFFWVLGSELMAMDEGPVNDSYKQDQSHYVLIKKNVVFMSRKVSTQKE